MANVQTNFEELKGIIGALYIENLILERQVAQLEATVKQLTTIPEAEEPKPTPARRRKAT